MNELTLTTHKALGLRTMLSEHNSEQNMIQIPLNFTLEIQV